MNEPLISVIIPVYNVEPYLRRCLDSVTGQTYRNLEIILVDDGSTDGSGTICDEYAVKDSRVQVIHKENGGVSSARNAGLTATAGRWIGWVDSDDRIEPDMFAYLLNGVERYGADIAVCSRRECFRDSVRERGWQRETLLNREEALGLLLKNDEMQNYLWDKLWRRELFAGLTFPEGRTYEDIAVMHRLFERAEKTVCLPEAKYNYTFRPDSIMGNLSLKNKLDHYHAVKDRLDDMLTRWPQFSQLLKGQCAAAAVGIWTGYLQNSRTERRRYQVEIQEISHCCIQWRRPALDTMCLGPTGKMVVCLTPYPRWWAFACARVCGWLYRSKYGREL